MLPKKSTSNGCYFKLGSPSLNFSSIWHPSQNGLFVDLPQRQSVTRLRVSYLLPSAPSISIPPFTQTGPLACFRGSSIKPISFFNSGSMDSPFLLRTTSRPDGHKHAWRTASFFRFRSFEFCVLLQTSPFWSWQNLARAQSSGKSSKSISGPETVSHLFAYISLFAVRGFGAVETDSRMGSVAKWLGF